MYAGSSSGRREDYPAAARALGLEIAKRGMGLVYGGGGIGLMAEVARAAIEAGAEVIGVMPHALRRFEVGHVEGVQLIEVASMHERKQRMADLADGFVALPGGLGTLDELCEAWTWQQLGISEKPIGLLNVLGYFDGFLEFLSKVSSEGFSRGALRLHAMVADEPAELLHKMEGFRAESR